MNTEVYDLEAALDDDRVLFAGEGDVYAADDADRVAWASDDDGYEYEAAS